METMRRKGNPTYSSWVAMKCRCSYEGHTYYHRYGGRGITFDERWNSFDLFLADMGERPSGTSLDRKDTDGNYTKDNCVWSPRKAQCNNRNNNVNITIEGKTKTLAQWCDHFKVDYMMVYQRLFYYGWDTLRAFTQPSRRKQKE